MKYKRYIITGLVLFTIIACQGFFIPNEEDTKFKIHCSVYPDLGTPGTEFSIKINAISVNNDFDSHLARHTFRWDFNADGIFDTEMSAQTETTTVYETPGEKEIIIQVETPGLYIYQDTITVQVGSLIRLYDNLSGTDVGSVDMAPDGSNRIAFDAPTVNGGSAIWVFQIPNGPLEQISQSPAYFPEWSPDGKYILFRRNNEYCIVDVETKVEQLIFEKSGILSFIPNWSHNGRDLVYANYGGIETYRFSSQRTNNYPTDITYSLATWSLDDQQVAVASRGNGQSLIELFDIEEGKISDSYTFEFRYKGGKLDWSTNNKWLSAGFANDPSIIHIINLRTNEVKYIGIKGLQETWYASWSPDSKMLVFEGKAPGENTTIWGIEIPENLNL